MADGVDTTNSGEDGSGDRDGREACVQQRTAEYCLFSRLSSTEPETTSSDGVARLNGVDEEEEVVNATMFKEAGKG